MPCYLVQIYINFKNTFCYTIFEYSTIISKLTKVISNIYNITALFKLTNNKISGGVIMESSAVILVLILAAAVLGHADSVAVAACILLFIKLLHLDNYMYPFIKDNGMFWGVTLLVAAILLPIANGQVKTVDIRNSFTSWIGITAIILSFLTTYLSGMGLRFLTVQGHTDVMPAMIIGAVGAAAFLGGVPVGPLITSGILAVIAKLVTKQ